MSTRPLFALPFVLVSLGACASDPGDLDRDERVESVGQRIVNGVPSTAADDHVVKIAIGNGGLCTGTLLTPNLVLTARHCVSRMNENSECGTFTGNLTPSTIAISIGARSNTIVARATRFFTETATGGCSNDIALFQLDRDLTSAKTAKVRLYKLTIGEPASTVGFGDSGNGQLTPGRYAKTGIKVDAVGPASYVYKTKSNQSIPVSVPPGEIVTGESTCFGDSGGPLFDGAGNVIGVTSRGIDERCIDRPSIYSDTASHAALIRNAAKTAGHPLQEAAEPGTTTEPPGNPGPKTNDPAPQQDEEEEEESTRPPPKKSPGSSKGSTAGDDDAATTMAPNAGCSASPATSASSSSGVVILAVCLGLSRIARRRKADRA
ncbi:MAG: S1 family peptidase [Labilithrix sp.]|nr:S1 family peptidase [Labilithrix sp.]